VVRGESFAPQSRSDGAGQSRVDQSAKPVAGPVLRKMGPPCKISPLVKA
jgi:hypothetical protein